MIGRFTAPTIASRQAALAARQCLFPGYRPVGADGAGYVDRRRSGFAAVPYRGVQGQAFDQVVARCGEVPRRGQSGTWITDEMREGYRRLHQMGAAHSVEAWEGSDLVGGLYGVCVGSVFCGESMFALRPDASKVAFVTAMRHLQQHGLTLVDCQIETAHLRSLGAESLAREDYLGHLRAHLGHSLAPGAWSLPEDFEACPAKA